MARTVVPVQTSTRGALVNLGTIAASVGGIAIDQVNGHSINFKRSHRGVVLVYNSKAGPIQVTIAAGVYPPAESAGLGALVFAGIPTVQLSLLTGFEGARQLQAGGLIFLDTDAGATGYLWAIEMPN